MRNLHAIITLVIYLLCKHKYIITIVASLILHKIKEVEANSNPNPETDTYECGTLAYITGWWSYVKILWHLRSY